MEQRQVKAREGRGTSAFFGMLLYFATLVFEIPGFLSRLILWFILLTPVLCAFLVFLVRAVQQRGLRDPGLLLEFVSSEIGSSIILWSLLILILILSGGNIVMSVLVAFGSLIRGFTGGTYTRFLMGARRPSKREREQVAAAFERIFEVAPDIRAPISWYVVDNTSLNAAVVGNTIYINKGLIWSPYLTGVLAHELGHLNALDGQLILALNMLVMPYVHIMRQFTGDTGAKLGGLNHRFDESLSGEVTQQLLTK